MCGWLCGFSFVFLLSFISFIVFCSSFTFPSFFCLLDPLSDTSSVSVSPELLCWFAHKPTKRLLTTVRFRTVCFRGGMGSLVLLEFCRFGWGAFWKCRALAFREALGLRVRLQYWGTPRSQGLWCLGSQESEFHIGVWHIRLGRSVG